MGRDYGGQAEAQAEASQEEADAGPLLKILCVCDKGVNRSVHIASLLKFRGHDTIPVGVDTASPETLDVLTGWADLVVLTNESQMSDRWFPTRVWIWPLEDLPRPYNRVLYSQVLRYIDEYRDKLMEGA